MTSDDLRARAEVGDLATVIATPNDRGTAYVAHAQIREALARHILASDWLAAHDAEVARGVAERIATAISERADTALIDALEDLAYRDAARIAREATR